jgi:hypothetical protein
MLAQHELVGCWSLVTILAGVEKLLRLLDGDEGQRLKIDDIVHVQDAVWPVGPDQCHQSQRYLTQGCWDKIHTFILNCFSEKLYNNIIHEN